MEDRRVPTRLRRLWTSVLNWLRMVETAGAGPDVDPLARRVRALEAESRARSPVLTSGDASPGDNIGSASGRGGRAEATSASAVRRGLRE